MNAEIQKLFGGSYAAGSGLVCAPITLSPSLADEMLSKNFHRNRTPNRSNIVRFANALRKGEFLPGSVVRIVESEDGYVVTDGQHRLAAVKESGIPAPFVVVLSPLKADDDYTRADQIAAIRNMAHNLKARGIGPEMSATVTGAFGSAIKIIHNGMKTDDMAALSKMSVINTTGVEYEDAMELLLDWTVGIKGRSSTSRGIYKSGVLAVALVTSKYQPEKAREFWSKAVMDDGLTRDNPIKWMSDHLAQASSAVKKKGMSGSMIARSDMWASSLYWNNHFCDVELNEAFRPHKYKDYMGVNGTPFEVTDCKGKSVK